MAVWSKKIDEAEIEIVVNMAEPYFRFNNILIYDDDILETRSIEDDSIDLIVTSPPYDVDIKYENYNDSIPYSEYLEFTEKWLARCYAFTKDDGRFCLNVPLDKNKGGQQSVCADVITIANRVRRKYYSTIVWNEQNMEQKIPSWAA